MRSYQFCNGSNDGVQPPPRDQSRCCHLPSAELPPALGRLAPTIKSTISIQAHVETAFAHSATRLPGPNLRERWPSRLMATTAEDRLSFRQRQHIAPFRRPAIGRAIAIYEYAPLLGASARSPGLSIACGVSTPHHTLLAGGGLAPFWRGLCRGRRLNVY
jgi:hypothetical protein